MQVLIGGSVDYASAAGSIIAAAVRGAPVRLVLIVNSKPQFDLVGRPEIKSVQQLKGKVIGISSRGGAVDLADATHSHPPWCHAEQRRNPDRHRHSRGARDGAADRAYRRMSSQSAETAHPLPRRLQQARLFRGLPGQLSIRGHRGHGGKDQNQSIRILAFVRASLKGLQYYTQNRAESVDNISKYLGIKDPSLAGKVYDLHVSRLGGFSYLDETWMRGAIDFTKKSLGVTKEVPPSQVFDFSFAEKAMARIKN